VSDELEGRTALTLLSKPVSRRQFIIGKFLGIAWPAAVMTLVLGSLLLWTIASKVVYDMRESPSDVEVTWQLCHLEMARTAPALLLGFFGTVVLAAIGVALSTRLPMLANLVVCVSVYALGHLAPLVVQSSEGKFPIVTFVGQLIATVLPVLDHFDVPGAVVGSADVPASYLAWAAVYAALYSAAALVLALAMFEDRDLA
jgi:ABC-type Na+ efflux pump permease subunit